jgi:signal peptidase II
MAFTRRLSQNYTLLILACFFVADRILKIIALKGAEQHIFGDWFNFALYRNSGIAFSLQTGLDPLWLIIVVVIGAAFWLHRAYRASNRNEIIALTAIILGALSNIYDRIVFGAVLDYFELFKLNVSNLADWLIVFGAAWLVYSEFLKKPAEK